MKFQYFLVIFWIIFTSGCTKGDPSSSSKLAGAMTTILFIVAIGGGVCAVFLPEQDSKVAAGIAGGVALLASLILMA